MGEPVLALLDPDCRDGKHTSCVGSPCECPCHTAARSVSPCVSGDPYVREFGRLTEQDGMYVRVGVDYDCVTIQVGGAKAILDAAQAGEFARLFVSAVWQAGQQKRQLAEEVYEADGGDTHHEDDVQSRTACCPRETIPDSCSCPDDCECTCVDCDCWLGD